MNIKVLLGMPRLDKVDPESVIAGLCTASDRDIFSVKAKPESGSLLAYGFNRAFCDFLNGDYDFFLLLHADIYPKGPFLDILYDALQETQADVIHASVAIKDTRGLTSTAVGDRNLYWQPCRRLTMTELHKLPGIFDINDVCSVMDGPLPNNPCLLPNTGCLLIRKQPWCYQFPGFCIVDRIKRDGTEFVAEVNPEDWNFGLWCARNKVRVLGTNKIEVEHYGRASFPNNHAWGNWDTDKHYESYITRRDAIRVENLQPECGNPVTV